MARGLDSSNSSLRPGRRRSGGRTRSTPSCSPPRVRSPGSPTRSDVCPPQAYMKQVKLHPSGCQQWSSQIVAGGGVYMAYASTLTTYVYDVRDFSLVTILGGNDCNVHSLLWHPRNPHQLLVLRINGCGTQWDLRSEERVLDMKFGISPACSAWDPADPDNLAIISKGTNETYLFRKGGRGAREFVKGYSRRAADKSVKATCMQWSRYKPGELVAGWTDGRVSFSDTSPGEGKGNTKLLLPNKEGGAIVDVRHDPHGGAFVLIGYKSGSVILWDVTTHCSLGTFERCAVGLTGIRWMAWASGNFLALSSKTGVARVFNISQRHSIGTVRLGGTGSGVRDMAWLPAQPCHAQLDAVGTSTKTESTGPRAICGFRDGSVSMADTAFHGKTGGGGGGGISAGGSGAIPWASKAGHVETIFACAHKPEDPDTLATGSYGSSVKVWHVPTMDLKVTLNGQTGAIYSLAWSADGRRIASTSGEGTVWIWDAESGKPEQRLRLHTRASHRAQWDPFNTTRLASTGADGSLVIFSEQGTVERVYGHPGALFGCDWCPGIVNIIATGCQDRNVRVFDVSSPPGSEPQYILSGHIQRVFHVSWSPLLQGTLASGSDDGSIMVWCLEPGALSRPNPGGTYRTLGPSAVLKGHTSNVRPLHWNSEVPWLLLSGSWDGTVRAWDVRRAGIGQLRGPPTSAGGAAHLFDADGNGACIAVMNDHVADVYGISAAPGRPFLYTSVSRDTTLRQFTLEGVVSSVKTRAVVGNTLAGSLGDTKEAMLLGSPTLLCGGASRLLETKLYILRRSEGLSSVDASRKVFEFFWGSDGIDTFWEMVRWVTASSTHASNPVLTSTPQRSRAREQQPGDRTSNGRGGSVAADVESTPICLRETPGGLMVMEERVVHRHARRASDKATANRLQNSPLFIVQDRRLSKSDCVERASRLHVATGDLRSSCEALVGVGWWERALALAPGVDLEYWRELSGRYVDVLQAGGRGRDNGEARGEGGLDASSVTAFLVSTGRAAEAIDALEGSDEALTLAATIADGAFPPPAPSEISSEERSPPPTNSCREGGDGRRNESKEIERRAENALHPEDGAEAKLLAVINDVGVGYRSGGREGALRSRGGLEEIASAIEEGKASPKEAFVSGRQGEREGHGFPPDSARRLSLEGEFKGAMSTTESDFSFPHTRGDASQVRRTALAVQQRDYGEAMLHNITRLKAEGFFRASQPALAASAVLSVCDGNRSMAAPAMSFLLRGEEPELAYSAARALRFPARELGSLAREMARRAEAWGDPNLSAELLLNAGGDDGIVDRRHSNGGSNAAETPGDLGGVNTAAGDGGHWPADLYGTCGEEAGPRGAATVMSRTRSSPDAPGPSVKLRSKTSYLEDAAAAESRGMEAEVIRLLVLGGDLEHAAERGVSFLRTFVSALTLPARSLKAASAVVRALGNGSGLCSLSNRVSPALRTEVLAYSSYIGALEAMVRGYHPVVTPLLRNTSNCVQTATRLSARLTEREERADADEKNGPDEDDCCSTARRRPRRRKSPHWKTSFPPCMSVGALALAAIEHIMAWSAGGGGPYSVEGWVGPRCTREAALRVARRIRIEEDLPAQIAKNVDDLLLSAECGAAVAAKRMAVPIAGTTPLTSPASSGVSETKGGDDAYNDNNGQAYAAFSTRNDQSINTESCEARVPTSTGGASSSAPQMPWQDDYLDVVVGGSRLPSCRHHERVAWRTQQNTATPQRRNTLAGYLPPSTASPDFGQDAWPTARGATFLLEDGETAMGLNEAVMWAKVNPFSPLNTGSRIMPF